MALDSSWLLQPDGSYLKKYANHPITRHPCYADVRQESAGTFSYRCFINTMAVSRVTGFITSPFTTADAAGAAADSFMLSLGIGT